MAKAPPARSRPAMNKMLHPHDAEPGFDQSDASRARMPKPRTQIGNRLMRTRLHRPPRSRNPRNGESVGISRRTTESIQSSQNSKRERIANVDE